jgi:hypothetical protein
MDKLSDLVIYIDNIPYTIPPAGYLMDNLNGFKCTILVGGSGSCVLDVCDDTVYVLGDTFIRNYYTVLNFTSFEIGFAPTAFPPNIENLSDPTKTGLSTGWIIVIVLAVAIAIFFAMFMLKKKGKCCFRQRTVSETSDSEALNLYK